MRQLLGKVAEVASGRSESIIHSNFVVDADIMYSLAYAELWFTVGVAFRRFDFELFDTTIEDVTMKHDYFIGCAGPESKGVRMKVVRELQ